MSLFSSWADCSALVCEAWLGPAYQITTQSNAIRAGSDQQEIHRDYRESQPRALLTPDMSHWGARCAEFPLVTHVANQFMTLQCAIAHTDQPLTSGPTRFLPYSNQLPNGYLNIRRQEFKDFVGPRMSQMPLEIGDAAFFNPTTFHQPGVNETDIHRAMNLFQVNSSMSRAMDTKNTIAMTKAVWPIMYRWHKEIQANAGGSGSVVSGSLHSENPLTWVGTLRQRDQDRETPSRARSTHRCHLRGIRLPTQHRQECRCAIVPS